MSEMNSYFMSMIDDTPEIKNPIKFKRGAPKPSVNSSAAAFETIEEQQDSDNDQPEPQPSYQNNGGVDVSGYGEIEVEESPIDEMLGDEDSPEPSNAEEITQNESSEDKTGTE